MSEKTKTKQKSGRGGKRLGAGRPKSTTPNRDAWVRVAVYREQREMWAAAAEEAGVSMAEAVRDAVDAWARKQLEAAGSEA